MNSHRLRALLHPTGPKATSFELAWFLVVLAAFAALFALLDWAVSAGLATLADPAVPVAHGYLQLSVLSLLVAIATTLPKWWRARRAR